jgi:fatty-acyl-CoA synthase
MVLLRRRRRKNFASASECFRRIGRSNPYHPDKKGALVSNFSDTMYANARTSTRGMVTGEPHAPVRHTWDQVHERARHIAGGLAHAGVGHGDAVAVLAGAPVEIAPTAQGVWMRGGSLTMLHQPTPRTDFGIWTAETGMVVETIETKVVIVSEPFLAAVPILAERGIHVVTIDQLLAADPIGPLDTDDDDIALLQLTSGSTGPPKAVQITHRNLASNAEAMFVGAEYDLETDVIVSWLPLFHDMGMTGFLVVPMYFGAELVKITPIDFLRDTLLWARLIDKYKATMTAAPNFAYALLAKRLRRQAEPGQFDLSSLRWALSGAEQVEPVDVEDLCDAGAPFGLRPEAILPAYGMAETTVAVSFSKCGAGLIVDEVDADMLAVLHRAVPSTNGNTRRLATLGPLLQGLEARIVDEDANVLPARGVGVIQVRGEPLTRGYTTTGGFVSAQDDQGWYDTGDLGYLMENGHVVVCGRVKDVIIMAGRKIYPTDVERAAWRVDGVRRGSAVAVRLNAGRSREGFAVAVESKSFDDSAEVRRIQRQVVHEVVAEVNARPRNVAVLRPGSIPKTPSGKLRRAHALALVGQ